MLVICPILSGKLFQRTGPDVKKAQSPNVLHLVFGNNCFLFLSRSKSPSGFTRIRFSKYESARPSRTLETSRVILKITRYFIDSQ